MLCVSSVQPGESVPDGVQHRAGQTQPMQIGHRPPARHHPPPELCRLRDRHISEGLQKQSCLCFYIKRKAVLFMELTWKV